MRSYEIYISDWSRVFLGEVPAIFYLEVFLRTVFIYIVLMVSLRLMGKRMATQLSRNEMAAMVSLAAAIGVPILDPGRGLLPIAIIAFVVVTIQRFVTTRAAANQKFERVVDGDYNVLVEDGLTFPDRMRISRITQERLFAQLRSEGILHLGEVKRLYLEAGGAFSLVKQADPEPGLSVLPLYDKEFRERKKFAEDLVVCGTCGKRSDKGEPGKKGDCDRCGGNDWHPAML